MFYSENIVLYIKDNGSSSEAENTRVSSEHQVFQEKFRTLQQNVAVLTEQKQHMEQMYQIDKRKLKVCYY